MNRSMEDTIMAFTEKYEGDFRRIYQAIATKERLTMKKSVSILMILKNLH